MFQSDFQERLDRLHMNSTSAGPIDEPDRPTPKTHNSRPSKLSWLIVLGFTLAGSRIARFANEEYDMIKATHGVEAALLTGSVALALVLIGSILFLRALWNQFKPNR